MSRDLEDSDYYVSRGGMIPVKWTAPEVSRYFLTIKCWTLISLYFLTGYKLQEVLFC